jgi:hypothetical protein
VRQPEEGECEVAGMKRTEIVSRKREFEITRKEDKLDNNKPGKTRRKSMPDTYIGRK